MHLQDTFHVFFDIVWLFLNVEVPRTGLHVKKLLEGGGCHKNQDRVHHIEKGAKYVVEVGRWIVELYDTWEDKDEMVCKQEARD